MSALSRRNWRTFSRPWPIPLASVAEPRAALFDDVLSDAEVKQIAFLRDSFAIDDVELGFAERRSHLVLDDFDFGSAARDGIAVLNGRDTTNVQANGRIELQGAATGGGF